MNKGYSAIAAITAASLALLEIRPRTELKLRTFEEYAPIKTRRRRGNKYIQCPCNSHLPWANCCGRTK